MQYNEYNYMKIMHYNIQNFLEIRCGTNLLCNDKRNLFWHKYINNAISKQ